MKVIVALDNGVHINLSLWVGHTHNIKKPEFIAKRVKQALLKGHGVYSVPEDFDITTAVVYDTETKAVLKPVGVSAD